MKIDPAELRRRNFIAEDAFPYQTPVALHYDSGDYFTTLDMALKTADYAGFEKRRAEAAKRGKLRGIGFCDLHRGLRHRALGGGRRARRARRALRDRPRCACNPTGTITRLHRLAQPRPGPRDDLRPARLRPARRCRSRMIEVVHGDTGKIPVRHGHLRLALARRSAARRSSRRSTRSSPRARRSPPICSRRPRPTSSSRTASSRSPAPTRTCRSARSPSPPMCRTTIRSTSSSPASTRPPSTTRRTSPIPAGTPHLRGRDRPRHRRRRARALHRGRRFRPHHQSDDRRGPGPWRPRPGHRPGAARERGLRQRDGPARHRLVHGLLHAARRRLAVVHSSPPTSRCARTIRSASRAAARPARSARRRR